MRTELVTTLKRQATELLSDLERSKEPILITQHGVVKFRSMRIDAEKIGRASCRERV